MSASDALAWFNAQPVHTVDLDGTPLAYRDVGDADAPAIIMVHGWPLSSTSWRNIAYALQNDVRCLVLDLPGAGQSPLRWHHDEFFQNIAATLDLFTAALGLQHYALAGYDSGAAGCRLHAARHPDRVAALLLSNTEVPDHTPTLVAALKMAAFLPLASTTFKLLLSSSAYRKSRFGFGGCFVDERLHDGPFKDATLPALNAGIDGAMAHIRRADLKGLDARLKDAHQKLTMPSQLVWGAQCPFFDVVGAKKLQHAMPGCEGLHVVDDAKLLVHEEALDTYLDVAVPFLRRHLSPPQVLRSAS